MTGLENHLKSYHEDFAAAVAAALMWSLLENYKHQDIPNLHEAVSVAGPVDNQQAGDSVPVNCNKHYLE